MYIEKYMTLLCEYRYVSSSFAISLVGHRIEKLHIASHYQSVHPGNMANFCVSFCQMNYLYITSETISYKSHRGPIKCCSSVELHEEKMNVKKLAKQL